MPPRLPVRVDLVREPWGIWRSLTAARRNLLSILPDIATRQPIVSGRTGKRWHMVMDPEAIRTILLERLDNYPKSLVTKNVLRPAIGESLFIAEGAHWRWQRRAAAPVFSHRNVTNLGPVMSAAAQRACDRVAATAGRPVDMNAEMTRATFDVISDVTFSGGQGFDRAAIHRALEDYIAEAARLSLFDIIGLPDWVPRPARLLARGALREMKQVADAAIAERTAHNGPEIPDLLDLLMQGEDPETRRRMQGGVLRDNLLTFIVAGHETTALTLSWALYLLAFDPEIQKSVRAEARAVLGASVAQAEDLPALPLTRQVVEEALRLYPPAGILSRTAQARDQLVGRTVLPGDTVMIPIYALHRNHLLWDNPDAFVPARFADRKAIERYAYLPFGDGPRICIGASFALQEAVILLASLIARFDFAPVPGLDPRPVMILTLRPEGGVWLTATPL